MPGPLVTGAAAVVVFNNQPGTLNGNIMFGSSGQHRVRIPSVFVTEAQGEALKHALLRWRGHATVSLDCSTASPSTAPTVPTAWPTVRPSAYPTFPPGVDCAGTPNGAARRDRCDRCDHEPSNDCHQDCRGVWGASTALDACGVCGGKGVTCRATLLEDMLQLHGAPADYLVRHPSSAPL